MHVNFHFAVGIIFSTMALFLVNLITGVKYSIFEFILFLFCTFGADLDIIIVVLLGKIGKETGHRFFITHSIYPVAILLIIGIFTAIFEGYHVIWICGIAYFSHILLDCFDGEVSLFYTEKMYGLSLLLTKEEKGLFLGIKRALDSEKERNPYFMDIRYYSNKIFVSIEIILSILSLVLLLFLYPQFWFMYLMYFPLLSYHIYYFLRGKKIEKINILSRVN